MIGTRGDVEQGPTLAKGREGQDGSTSQGASRNTGRRLRGAVANRLGVAILSGEFAPGDTLSGEIAFSEALNISRSAYREAIQVLTAKGLVESRPKAGTRVLPRQRWNLLDPDVLAWAFMGEPDEQLIRSLFELRLIMEPAAAGLAATRRDRDDLKAMKDALVGMRRHSLATDQGRLADRQFHSWSPTSIAIALYWRRLPIYWSTKASGAFAAHLASTSGWMAPFLVGKSR